MSIADWAGAFLGLFFTLVVFSYLLKDNVLFRLVIHLFIGVTAGLVVVVAWYSVILPQLIRPFFTGDWKVWLAAVFPLVLSLLLLTRMSRRLAFLGSPVLALMAGVGAATAIGGVVLGTVYPQVKSTIDLFGIQTFNYSASGFWLKIFNAIIVLVGVISTLVYFQFGVSSRKMDGKAAGFAFGNAAGTTTDHPGWLGKLGRIGQGFMAVAFGALFTGVLLAALVALIARLETIIRLIENLLAKG